MPKKGKRKTDNTTGVQNSPEIQQQSGSQVVANVINGGQDAQRKSKPVKRGKEQIITKTKRSKQASQDDSLIDTTEEQQEIQIDAVQACFVEGNQSYKMTVATIENDSHDKTDNLEGDLVQDQDIVELQHPENDSLDESMEDYTIAEDGRSRPDLSAHRSR